MTCHAYQESCPITLNRGWQSSDILASLESLFLVNRFLNEGQLAKEVVFSVPAEPGERLERGCHAQGAGWQR